MGGGAAAAARRSSASCWSCCTAPPRSQSAWSRDTRASCRCGTATESVGDLGHSSIVAKAEGRCHQCVGDELTEISIHLSLHVMCCEWLRRGRSWGGRSWGRRVGMIRPRRSWFWCCDFFRYRVSSRFVSCRRSEGGRSSGTPYAYLAVLETGLPA